LTAPTDAELLAQQKNKDDQRARDEQSIRWEKIPLRPFDWRLGEKNIVHDANWRIASIASGFPDINDDGESDVLVGVKDHPTLVALSGKSGQRQWRYSSLPTGPSGHLNYHLETGSMNAPVVVGDIDGDGVNDVTAQFYREELRWIDAVSGRTGKKLWRIKIPETWFDPALIDKKKASTKTVVPLACQISLNGHFHRHDHWVGFDNKYYQGSLSRQPFGGFVVPWQSTLLAKKNLLLTVCGSRLIGHDSNTGEPSPSFNDGQPLELGYFPALQPQIIRNDDGEIMGLLLCEMVEQAICGVNKCKPETRFHLLSLDTAAPLWTFTTTCDPGWTGTTPDWPLIEDINGDGTPEIIVADGGDLEIEVFQDRSLICTMQAIDGNTGKAIWDQTRLPKLRCGFRQIQNVVVGPDADGDQLDDIYAVCPMVLAASRQPMSIFIDVLSGTDGHKIRSVECVCPIWHGSPDLKKPFFWGTASDGSPQLVLSSKDNSSTGSGTIFVSPQSGEVNHIADGLNVRLQMPYVAANGNVSTNKKTLFLSSPRRGQNFVGTSNLVTMKPQPQTGLNLTDVNLQPSADLDGDGASDLLNVAESIPQISANSSSDGKVLWQHSPGGSILHTTTLDADLNTDGVKDVLVWALAAGHNQSKLTCLSGQNGQPLWVTDVECHGPLDSMHASIVPATAEWKDGAAAVEHHDHRQAIFRSDTWGAV